MAPPRNRRPGYSRRAQYSTFFGYIAGLGGAIVGAVLLIVAIVNPGLFSGLRTTATQAVEPVGGTVARARTGSRNFIDVAKGYATSGQRVAEMERELEEAKVRIAEAEALEGENRRLRALLELSRREPEPVAVTRITGSTAASSRRIATIGAGRSDGIEPGMPVRSSRGLVGRVIEVGSKSSRVLLITDSQSLVPVRRTEGDVGAFAQGKGDGTLRIRLLELGLNPLKKGDVFVTSGSGGLYREGVAIGVVTERLRDGAIARVLANPAATEFVIVEPMRAPEAFEPIEDEQEAEPAGE